MNRSSIVLAMILTIVLTISNFSAQLINLALINQTVAAIKFEDKDSKGRENAIWLVMAAH